MMICYLGVGAWCEACAGPCGKCHRDYVLASLAGAHVLPWQFCSGLM